MTKHLLRASIAALAAAIAAPATAQVAPQSGAPAGDAAELPGDIVVTGEKIARSVQDTATSVAVTTERRIEDENLQTLRDVFNRTVNVAETYGSSGFTIRGIANRGVSGAGDAPLSTIYVDGAALPDQIVGFGPTDLWDVAQVEIFRGPQSTLQGLNALAGAVVIRTADPTMDWSGRARVTLAEYDTTAFAAAIGGPIVADELAFRIAAEKRDSDGFIRNVTRNAGENPVDSLLIRGKLLWTPTALPGFTARASYTRLDREGGYSFSYTDTDRPNYYEDRVATSDYPNDSDSKADVGTLELTYEIGSGLSLSSVTSYSEVSLLRRFDGDVSAAPLSSGINPFDAQTWTQELRLNVEAGAFTGLLGAFYYNRDQFNRTSSLILVPTPVDTAVGLLQQAGLDAATATYVANLYAQALPAIPVQYDGPYDVGVETYAIFADGRFALNDRLSVLAGFRWDHERNQIAGQQTAEFVGTFPDPAAYGPLAPLIAGLNAGVAGIVAGAAGPATASRRTFDAFLPKLGVEMAWTPDLTTSFVVQRGYRSGGSSTNIARVETVAYDPEYTWNYELSLRSQWLDGRLTLNANAFYIDWTDQQVAVFLSSNVYDSQTVNAGKSHIYGFELEGSYRPSRALEVYASVGHVRSKFDEFQTSVGSVTDLSGLEFIYAPRLSLAAGVNWQAPFGVAVNVNANHRSRVFTDVTRPQDANRVGARTVVNAKLGYDIGAFTISAFVNNLFDEKYAQYIYAAENRAVLGDPQMFGALLEARF